METTTKKLANMDELLIAATDWLAPRCKKDADIARPVRQLADVCDAVQNNRDVFLVTVYANHYALIYVNAKCKVEQFFPNEQSFKALGYQASRSTKTLAWTLRRNMGIIGSQSQRAINDVLKAAGSTEQLQQLSSSRF